MSITNYKSTRRYIPTHKNLIFIAKDAVTEAMLNATSHTCDWSRTPFVALDTGDIMQRPQKWTQKKECKFYFGSYCVRRCSRCMQHIHDFAAITAEQRRPHFVLVPHPLRRSKIRKNEARIRWQRHRLLSQYSSFPCQYYSTKVTHAMLNVPSTLHNVINWQSLYKVVQIWPGLICM